ncbi:ligand-binding sensor domain-containing diguanylate cyclase [Cognatilysobacter bugurensis]|uniref:diguanylate cyclase n=1 Tax=Cognatilysobacter bugurensis TaxID=543356 RepID=A0A918W8H4_9GAMM|nr:ligand-binding sensor domain-containing diguanylate cyclase [Lysobacter bugurensis]GHA77653.1 GGDEF domain-containing protein [Lysobacter bugurensis]
MKRFIALSIVLLFAVLFAWPAAALDPDEALHRHVRGSWSIEDGMPQISALAIAQDREGYIWVGTQAGLARFDGVRFTSYTPETEPGLAGMQVRALHAGRDGRVWIGTYKGLSVRDGGGFRSLPPADPKRYPQLDIYAITEDANGTVWVAANDGVFRVAGDRLHAVAGGPVPALSLAIDRDGLHAGGRGAVHRLSARGWQVQPLPADAATAAVNRVVRAQGRLWAATALGLYTREADGWVAHPAPALQSAPFDMLQPDSDGNLWVGGDTGLGRLRDGRLVEFVAPSAAGGIPGVRVAFEDREGSLWIGSQWQGLVRMWDSWITRYSTPEGLDERIVWSVAPDPDGRRTWVGTNDGVSLLEGGRFRTVIPGRRLPHPQGYNLFAEPGRVWVGTRRGVVLFDPDASDARTVERPAVLEPLDGLQINGIVRDGEAYWIPTMDGLFRLDLAEGGALEGGRLRRFGPDDGLADARVRYVHRTPGGEVLVGTQSGLYTRQGDRFVEIGRAQGLPPDLDVISIASLKGGGLAIGTLGERLHVFDGRRWAELDADHGMPRNSPFFLTEHDGVLWSAGLRGIGRVPVADLRAFMAGRLDRVRGEMLLNERGDAGSGQQGYCCNGAGTAKGFVQGNTLWLPSRDGVVAMDTTGIVKNTTAPRVVIERIRVDEQWRAAEAMAGASLPVGARDVSFEFTVPSFQDPESVGVEYRLAGYDRDWRIGDALNRSAHYTNLPPGDYAFEARGSNNAGVRSAGVARLRFSIPPRFHETALFYALSALLLASLVFAGYRLQKHRYRMRQRELESIVQQRTEALEIANRRLEEASQTDPLTGLRNRRYMANQIPADLAFYDRRRQQGEILEEAIVFALVDIDHFKTVNDRHGHRAGDRVLQQFAQVLSALVRGGDYVVRWGGEEFLIVFRPMEARHLSMLGDRIRTAVADHAFDIGTGTPLRITCSAGLVEYPLFRDHRMQLGWEAMVELADQALYYMKTHGRDGWAAFRPTASTDISTLLTDLQHGPDDLLADGRLALIHSREQD